MSHAPTPNTCTCRVNPHYHEEFPDGSLGGFAYTYRNVQRNSEAMVETLYLNLVLAIRQINALKAASPQTYLPDEGLTYTDTEFQDVVNLCNANALDARIHQVLENGENRAWTSDPNQELVDGFRVFMRLNQ